jgi:hypothetical protein|tara:strand:+ start:297 stop:503 length:207 start_codon:yes stop_codon:yes gene_type:complete
MTKNIYSDVELADVDTSDAPDFCDAYVESACVNGRQMTDVELENLNEDYALRGELVYANVHDFLCGDF